MNGEAITVIAMQGNCQYNTARKCPSPLLESKCKETMQRITLEADADYVQRIKSDDSVNPATANAIIHILEHLQRCRGSWPAKGKFGGKNRAC